MLLLCSINVQATGIPLIPLYTPDPVFPEKLKAFGGKGEVRLKFTVQPDGTTKDIQILETTHPKYADSAEQAVSNWHFKPNNQAPERQFILPLSFSLGRSNQVRRDMNVALLKVTCRQVNKAVADWERYYSQWSLGNMRFFIHTRGYLQGQFMAASTTDAEQKTLLVTLSKALPGIVQNCRKNPNSYYADHLPEQIKNHL
ncbi:MAG: TonB protein [Pseudomonas sp.]|nr:TonB protein [Pseudomonas sp.]